MKQIVLVLLLTGLSLNSCNRQTVKKQMAEAVPAETEKKANKKKTIHLNKVDFLNKVANYESNPSEWEYLGDKPALIDFYADWCGPCKAIAPVLEKLAAEYDGQIYIYKIDTEQEQELAAIFGIRSIPSLLFVPMDGKPRMAQGALPKHVLKQAINEVLLDEKE